MADTPMETPLEPERSDYVASAAKSVLGAIPFVGSLLVELAGTIVPNQRVDRIARFAATLEQRLSQVEGEFVQAQVNNDEFTDLIEEALRQAARSTTDERREYIAALIANSLSPEQVAFQESKHLLRILGDISDIEVIWLRFYLHPTMDGDEEFREKHRNVLEAVGAPMGSPQPELDKETLRDSYREHLARLGLLNPRYRTDTRTKQPKFDSRTGAQEIAGYQLTPLGRLLLRQIGLTESTS